MVCAHFKKGEISGCEIVENSNKNQNKNSKKLSKNNKYYIDRKSII